MNVHVEVHQTARIGAAQGATPRHWSFGVLAVAGRAMLAWLRFALSFFVILIGGFLWGTLSRFGKR